MNIFLSLATIWAFFKTISYGIFELKKNNNKSGSILVIATCIIGFVFANIVIWFVN